MLTQSPAGGALRPVADVVDRRVRRRRGRRRAAGLDDRGAALLHGRDERVSIHAWSTSSVAGLPFDLRVNRSGYCVAEWLPQIVMLRDVGDRHLGTSPRAAPWRGCGRAASSR